DVYDLSVCILQQALIGQTPNQLFIDYLNHCVSSQIVSYGAVLSAIAKFQEMQKSQCILCLLNLVISFKQRIGCYGNEEECITLCKSIVSLTLWIYSCVSHAFTVSVESKSFSQNQNQFNYQHHNHHHHSGMAGATGASVVALSPFVGQTNDFYLIIEKIADILNYISNSSFLKALFYVGKMEDPSTYSQLLTRVNEVESKITTASNLNAQFNKEVLETILGFMSAVEWNKCTPTVVASKQLQSTAIGSNNQLIYDSVFRSLNAVIAFDAVLNPVCEIDVCAEQIFLISKFNDISLSDLCCEIIRACFVGLVDSGGSGEDLKWAAFTFLKAPQLLVKLIQMKGEKSKGNLSNDLEVGLEKLLAYTPLLDLTDTKSNCDCLELFLKELCKTELLTENKKNRIMSLRQKETTGKAPLSRADQSQAGQGASLILRAEPTVTSILKTLDSDYSKNQDALLGVLCHMVPGKSFELILNAAAATGKLRSFTTKLIKFNEFNKQVTGEGGKASQTRALLFDITFLMLCHIAQNYGTEIVTANEETKDSFFATWCAQCLTEGGRYRNPDAILINCEQNKVDVLLNQFTSTDSEFKTSLVKWHEFCMNAPAAIKEILLAWEHEVITTDNVKLILDNVKSKMCCLPVVISAWLCSYINVLHHDERLKPINMVQQFMTPLVTDAANNNGSEQQSNSDFYKERSTLMAAIIKKMFYDLHPPYQTKTKGIISVISHGLTSKTPLLKIMETNFALAHDRSWLDVKTVHNMDTLLCVGGSNWFVDALVRHLLKFEHDNDLNRAVDMIFGLFHLDIEQCALSLLLNTLKSYLLNSAKQEQLCEPKISSLARLTVMTIFSALNELQNSKLGKQRSGRKKHHYLEDNPSDFDPFEADLKHSLSNSGSIPRPPKLPKSDTRYGSMTLLEETPFTFQQQQQGQQVSSPFLNEPLTKSIVELLRLLTVIITDSTVSPRTLFPLVFLEQLILCAKEDAHKILRFLPFQMIISLLKTFPETLTYEFLLSISNTETLKARKIVARALCQLKRAKKSRSYFMS
ncbi:mediator of RNA polymerase II transcription subunit 24-like protein, partial [Dinothrombium tinctorium]